MTKDSYISKKIYSNEHPKYKTLYNVGVGFTNTTDNSRDSDSGGKTITGADFKDFIEKPAGGKPVLIITRSKGQVEEGSLGYTQDPTKGEVSVEIGKDNFGLSFRKTYFQKGARRK